MIPTIKIRDGAAQKWLEWCMWLNRCEAKFVPGADSIVCVSTNHTYSFFPLENDIDKMEDVIGLCNDVSEGSITTNEFYKGLANLDVFDTRLLGPEYAWLSRPPTTCGTIHHPTYVSTQMPEYYSDRRDMMDESRGRANVKI